jgi:hypothetical protein
MKLSVLKAKTLAELGIKNYIEPKIKKKFFQENLSKASPRERSMFQKLGTAGTAERGLSFEPGRISPHAVVGTAHDVKLRGLPVAHSHPKPEEGMSDREVIASAFPSPEDLEAMTTKWEETPNNRVHYITSGDYFTRLVPGKKFGKGGLDIRKYQEYMSQGDLGHALSILARAGFELTIGEK